MLSFFEKNLDWVIIFLCRGDHFGDHRKIRKK